MSENVIGPGALWPQMISALAAIDDALGLEQDGCNSTEVTLTAIKLLKSAHRDDVAEIKRLTAERDRYRDDFRQRELDLGEMYETIRQANTENERLRKIEEAAQDLIEYEITGAPDHLHWEPRFAALKAATAPQEQKPSDAQMFGGDLWGGAIP